MCVFSQVTVLRYGLHQPVPSEWPQVLVLATPFWEPHLSQLAASIEWSSGRRMNELQAVAGDEASTIRYLQTQVTERVFLMFYYCMNYKLHQKLEISKLTLGTSRTNLVIIKFYLNFKFNSTSNFTTNSRYSLEYYVSFHVYITE